jgi:hypothetical protein
MLTGGRNVMKSLRQGLRSLAIVSIVAVSQSELLIAQGTTPPAPVTTPSNVVKQSRPYYVEGAVVVLLMAGAIYAVCRSSRRV